ncbi:hypothetical protein [Nocardia higoensis]|uniref:hypothetical protein n=1 Tax=Nocardia higoensis TaxID=228599 RepID=UPI0002E2945B|nr:hypothetical protein [Nocardia higoensis]
MVDFGGGEARGRWPGDAGRTSTGRSIASSIRTYANNNRYPWTYNHVDITCHPKGGHFIPWEIPGEWTADFLGTFRPLLNERT